MTQDFVIADAGLAEWGRREVSIAENEMPGLWLFVMNIE